jgi:transcriptional regulator with XRE-family HTH domain
MREKKPFRRGDTVLVRVKSPAGLITEQPGRVKEMAGARAVCVSVFGNDRIVEITHIRKVDDNEWIATPVSPLASVGPKLGPEPPDLRGHDAPRKPLAANLGEIAMAKTPTPSHFAPVKNVDPRDIHICMRATRTTRNLTPELMAQMLRVTPAELAEFESGQVVPDDVIVLRLADVLNIPLDTLSAALDHTREKAAKAKRAAEAEQRKLEEQAAAMAANEKKKQEQREASEKAASEKESPRSMPLPSCALRSVAETPRRTFEDFGEHLMDVCPVPIDKARRKQWYSVARQLFELSIG